MWRAAIYYLLFDNYFKLVKIYDNKIITICISVISPSILFLIYPVIHLFIYLFVSECSKTLSVLLILIPLRCLYLFTYLCIYVSIYVSIYLHVSVCLSIHDIYLFIYSSIYLFIYPFIFSYCWQCSNNSCITGIH